MATLFKLPEFDFSDYALNHIKVYLEVPCGAAPSELGRFVTCYDLM